MQRDREQTPLAAEYDVIPDVEEDPGRCRRPGRSGPTRPARRSAAGFSPGGATTWIGASSPSTTVAPGEGGPWRRRHRGQAEGPGQHPGDLGPGHPVVGAEAIVGRGVAAQSYPTIGDPIDGSLEHMSVVVDEMIRARRRDRQGPSQETCRLSPGDRVVRAEPVVGRWVTAERDPGRSETIDRTLEDMTRCRRRTHRWRWRADPGR